MLVLAAAIAGPAGAATPLVLRGATEQSLKVSVRLDGTGPRRPSPSNGMPAAAAAGCTATPRCSRICATRPRGRSPRSGLHGPPARRLALPCPHRGPRHALVG